jgi:hypothetical protein
MKNMKQLDEMADKLVPQILHKIYNTINTEIAILILKVIKLVMLMIM